MNIAKLFAVSARAWPHRPALLHGTTVLRDYGDMLRAVRQRSSWLASIGLQPGDRLALCMANRPEYLELIYAALWSGLTIVPVNTKLHAREVDYIVGHSRARAIISDHLSTLCLSQDVEPFDVDHLPDPAGYAQAAMHPCADDDLAWLFYTSGTTGRPKGAMLTHGNLLAATLSYRSDVEPVDWDDTYIYAAPVSHGAGLYTFAYSASAARHVFPVSGGFDAAETLDLASRLGQVCLFAAPTMVSRLVDEAERQAQRPRGIKCVVYGGGPMYLADIRRALEIIGPHFAQIYGQGETPMTITCMTRSEVAALSAAQDDRRLGSVGRSHSVVEVQVVDGDGRECAVGTLGEIVVRGRTVMQGYWENPTATASTLKNGWLHTGDIGAFDEQGFLTLHDRSKDVIISGGSNIYPREVEEALLEHPAVAEAAVIGARDDEWGEKVVAYVVLRDTQVTDAQLDELCVSRIARFKRPKEYVRIAELPKNNNGKVLKTELRTRHEATAAKPD